MNKCYKKELDGACCCTCACSHKLHSHPAMKVPEDAFVCIMKDYSDIEEPLHVTAMSEHGMCEMYNEKEDNKC